MSYALFDVLSGRFQDGSAVDRVDAGDALRHSVQDHLRRLLNARQGALCHLPDYGLPDVPALYGGLPYSADELALAVRRMVERFEPRLSEVNARIVPASDRRSVLRVEVSGRLPGGEWAQFHSRFQASGGAEVSAGSAAEARHA